MPCYIATLPHHINFVCLSTRMSVHLSPCTVSCFIIILVSQTKYPWNSYEIISSPRLPSTYNTCFDYYNYFCTLMYLTLLSSHWCQGRQCTHLSLSVRPSVWFHSIFETGCPLILNFGTSVGHDHGLQGANEWHQIHILYRQLWVQFPQNYANAIGLTSIKANFSSLCYN